VSFSQFNLNYFFHVDLGPLWLLKLVLVFFVYFHNFFGSLEICSRFEGSARSRAYYMYGHTHTDTVYIGIGI